MKIKIYNAGTNGSGFFAYLSNGKLVEVRSGCNPAAFGQLVSGISRITGQTDRGVKASLKKWIS